MFDVPWPENQENLKLVDAEQSLTQVFEKLEQKRQHLTSSYKELLKVKKEIVLTNAGLSLHELYRCHVNMKPLHFTHHAEVGLKTFEIFAA